MSEEFKPGDVVVLKSGGPKMTIAFRAESGNAWVCHWFEGATRRDGGFVPETLKKEGPPLAGAVGVEWK